MAPDAASRSLFLIACPCSASPHQSGSRSINASLTLHVDLLLLPKSRRQLLHFLRHTSLHILRRHDFDPLCSWRRRDCGDQVLTPSEVLWGVSPFRRITGYRLTLVMSAVCRSISRSSAVRSVKPGKTCLACSLSSAATIPSVSEMTEQAWTTHSSA